MSDMSIQRSMMGLIATTAFNAHSARIEHQRNKESAAEQKYRKERDAVKDEQFAIKTAQADKKLQQNERGLDIKEAANAEKARQFDVKTEEHSKDREQAMQIAEMQDIQRTQSNIVAAKEAETHRITANTRAQQQEANSKKLVAEAKSMDSKRLIENKAYKALFDLLKTNDNQKEVTKILRETIKGFNSQGQGGK